MRIIAEITRDILATEMSDFITVRTRVKIDGQEERHLSRLLSEDELQSNFDIIWEHMGKQLKVSLKESVAV